MPAGRFYGEIYNFEFEYIDNTSPVDVKLFSNVYYWAEAKKQDDVNITEFKKQTFPGKKFHPFFDTLEYTIIILSSRRTYHEQQSRHA